MPPLPTPCAVSCCAADPVNSTVKVIRVVDNRLDSVAKCQLLVVVAVKTHFLGLKYFLGRLYQMLYAFLV